MEWKWSTGEYYERSRRPSKISTTVQQNKEKIEQNMDVIKENSAYLNSLNVDTNGWGYNLENQYINNIIDSSASASINYQSFNKREENVLRVADREMMCQIGRNPFLDNSSDYVNDVAARDLFLKPISTSLDKSEIAKNENSFE